MKIIGISGTNGSGKDTVSLMLKERYGYFVASATEMLAAELEKRGLPTEREHKRAVGDEWRRQYGHAAIVEKAIEQAKAAGYDKLVVGSLRNPGEADRVHELGGTIVWVDADPKLRYQRITSNNRGRVEDNKTFEQFLAEEEIEMNHSGDSATPNMLAVKERADITLENDDSDIKTFKDQVEKVLAEYV
jgi:dephospho-CoA kinase